jgi:hypothetical protein
VSYDDRTVTIDNVADRQRWVHTPGMGARTTSVPVVPGQHLLASARLRFTNSNPARDDVVTLGLYGLKWDGSTVKLEEKLIYPDPAYSPWLIFSGWSPSGVQSVYVQLSLRSRTSVLFCTFEDLSISTIRPAQLAPRASQAMQSFESLLQPAHLRLASAFTVYQAGSQMAFVKDRCTREDTVPAFSITAVPAAGLENATGRALGTFSFLDGFVDAGSCRVFLRLPDPPPRKIRVQRGAGAPTGSTWTGEFETQ